MKTQATNSGLRIVTGTKTFTFDAGNGATITYRWLRRNEFLRLMNENVKDDRLPPSKDNCDFQKITMAAAAICICGWNLFFDEDENALEFSKEYIELLDGNLRSEIAAAAMEHLTVKGNVEVPLAPADSPEAKSSDIS
jgi:hypothetical protein